MAKIKLINHPSKPKHPRSSIYSKQSLFHFNIVTILLSLRMFLAHSLSVLLIERFTTQRCSASTADEAAVVPVLLKGTDPLGDALYGLSTTCTAWHEDSVITRLTIGVTIVDVESTTEPSVTLCTGKMVRVVGVT